MSVVKNIIQRNIVIISLTSAKIFNGQIISVYIHQKLFFANRHEHNKLLFEKYKI